MLTEIVYEMYMYTYAMFNILVYTVDTCNGEMHDNSKMTACSTKSSADCIKRDWGKLGCRLVSLNDL